MSSSDEESVLDLPRPFDYLKFTATKSSTKDSNCKTFKVALKEKFQLRNPCIEKKNNMITPLPDSSDKLPPLDTVTLCLSSAAIQSAFGVNLYSSLKQVLPQVRENTQIQTACIYWSRDVPYPLAQAPILYLHSAEDFLKHCITEESLLNFARMLKEVGHGGRYELILYGYKELKYKVSSNDISLTDASHLERLKEFSLLLYIKEFIHCIWMDNFEQVTSYIMHITTAVENLVRKGTRERTLLSEFGNRRKFTKVCKGSQNNKNTLLDIYKLILERSLGRQSKAIETITAVYPTLYRLRTAISKNTEQQFVRECTESSASLKNGARTISPKIASQIYRCFGAD